MRMLYLYIKKKTREDVKIIEVKVLNSSIRLYSRLPGDRKENEIHEMTVQRNRMIFRGHLIYC